MKHDQSLVSPSSVALLACSLLWGCATSSPVSLGSCFEPLPEWVTGRFVIVQPFCQDAGSGNIVGLTIDECGNAVHGSLRGALSNGLVRESDEGFVFESSGGPAPSLRLTLSEASYGGDPIVLVSPILVPDATYWGLRIRSQETEAERIRYCAGEESWVLTQPGMNEALAEGGSTFDGEEDAPVLVLGDGSKFELDDPRLPLTTLSDGFSGALNGDGSLALYDGSSLCIDEDGVVDFGGSATSVEVQVDWLVLDVDDADLDGEVSDVLVRRTAIAFGACE